MREVELSVPAPLLGSQAEGAMAAAGSAEGREAVCVVAAAAASEECPRAVEKEGEARVTAAATKAAVTAAAARGWVEAARAAESMAAPTMRAAEAVVREMPVVKGRAPVSWG